MSVTDWGRGLNRILEAADISQAQLADEVGIPRMSLNRYVRGERRPKSALVRRINEATAKLVRVPEARDYLVAQALRSGLIEQRLNSDQAEAVLVAVGTILDRFDREFVIDARTAADRALSDAKLTQAQTLALFVEAVGAHGRCVLARLEGVAHVSMPLVVLLSVFRKYHVPLERYLRTDEASRLRRVREFFRIWVESVVSSRFGEISEERRRGLIDAILEQFIESAEEIASIARSSSISNTARARSKSKPHRKGQT